MPTCQPSEGNLLFCYESHEHTYEGTYANEITTSSSSRTQIRALALGMVLYGRDSSTLEAERVQSQPFYRVRVTTSKRKKKKKKEARARDGSLTEDLNSDHSTHVK